MAVCCSLLPPRSEMPSRHSGCLNKVTRGDFISHVDDGRRIRAASLRYGRCEMWRHQCMAGKSARSFHAQRRGEPRNLAADGWAEQIRFPIRRTDIFSPLPAAECATRRTTSAHAAAILSRIFPPPPHWCHTARAIHYNHHPGNNQCQHASCYVLSRALPVKRNIQPGYSPHSPARKVRAVSRNLGHNHAALA